MKAPNIFAGESYPKFTEEMAQKYVLSQNRVVSGGGGWWVD